MGKSRKGKELGKGISQRKCGKYQGRFVDRFGKRQVVYGKTLNEVRINLRNIQYEDAKQLNVVTSNMTLNEWFEKWLDVHKKNCRDSTKSTYLTCYNRIRNELGWRKLIDLNLTIVQDAFNKLKSDKSRKDSKIVLSNMLRKAVDSDLITKNIATQINTTVTNDEKKEIRVLTKFETKLFLSYSENKFYYNLFVVALETGMRIGELCGLTWDNVDMDNGVIYVKHTLVPFQKNGKYTLQINNPKTSSGKRNIPLNSTALEALRKQKIQKQKLVFNSEKPLEVYDNLVFITRNNTPIDSIYIVGAIDTIVRNIQKTEKVEFKMFTPHTFRHTYATRWIEQGKPQKVLQKLLGHSKLQMTMDIYCHVTDDTLYSEVQKSESICI